MFTTLLETQRAALTAVIFIGTFLVAVALGRLLKQRAGVRFGVLYRLFCLTLAFYAALAFYGVHRYQLVWLYFRNKKNAAKWNEPPSYSFRSRPT